ncbi:hypothetical protein BN424_2967 [Carnobacterium maltaromaticum LMA28]|uniref:Uncharacterized protein n=1 Tax=Carnobacterium maltaromaticum LMA28 TaxID=1234679 RepID=K8EKM2_CARML|nr:hypothetical protein IV70_GL000091 [Carnobacterium maltaromaticum DSM 20342]CCO12388.2 hypothetical protein BN424_2967 [Carnobacterium maltaromaticum LMA28]
MNYAHFSIIGSSVLVATASFKNFCMMPIPPASARGKFNSRVGPTISLSKA